MSARIAGLGWITPLGADLEEAFVAMTQHEGER